jgi:CxxC motif-containing protein
MITRIKLRLSVRKISSPACYAKVEKSHRLQLGSRCQRQFKWLKQHVFLSRVLIINQGIEIMNGKQEVYSDELTRNLSQEVRLSQKNVRIYLAVLVCTNLLLISTPKKAPTLEQTE